VLKSEILRLSYSIKKTSSLVGEKSNREVREQFPIIKSLAEQMHMNS